MRSTSRSSGGAFPADEPARRERGLHQANALAWSVGDEFDAIVGELRAHGMTFDHYDLAGLALESDPHVAENFKGVWFKDPDGNIRHINGQ